MSAVPRVELHEALAAALYLWRSRHPHGATIDHFARREIETMHTHGEQSFRLDHPGEREAAEREYCRLYCISIELANRGLLVAGAGSPTRFTPIKPWFEAPAKTTEEAEDTERA